MSVKPRVPAARSDRVAAGAAAGAQFTCHGACRAPFFQPHVVLAAAAGTGAPNWASILATYFAQRADIS
ncbi:hypothetical protein NDU88_010325 [Pleurodeles waltl]|uniref:Uncharacterized protein n=1 Tax=Pleurodeles waltl TaxID=8319 RepID=A0AAV7S0C6_PLEWA|nr:hypothetical protein NDU88_010325 [Pleurodeles waltl]